MPHRHGAFGDDTFGRFAEKTAQVLGTPQLYAAPLILPAQTRQADRDKEHSERVDARHTKLEESARLTREIHAVLTPGPAIT